MDNAATNQEGANMYNAELVEAFEAIVAQADNAVSLSSAPDLLQLEYQVRTLARAIGQKRDALLCRLQGEIDTALGVEEMVERTLRATEILS